MAINYLECNKPQSYLRSTHSLCMCVCVSGSSFRSFLFICSLWCTFVRCHHDTYEQTSLLGRLYESNFLNSQHTHMQHIRSTPTQSNCVLVCSSRELRRRQNIPFPSFRIVLTAKAKATTTTTVDRTMSFRYTFIEKFKWRHVCVRTLVFVYTLCITIRISICEEFCK